MHHIQNRLLISAATVLFTLLLIGASESIIGVDVARTLLGPKPSQEEVAALKRQLGLDRSFVVRTYSRSIAAMKGDLGESYVFRQPVAGLLFQSSGNSFRLIVPALFFGGLAGVTLGIWIAYHPGGMRRHLLNAATSVALLPSLVLSTLVVYGLGYKLGWISPSHSIAVVLLSFVPLFITALTTFQEYAIILQSDYTRAARSQGFPEWMIALQSLKPAAVGLTTNFTNLALHILTATVFIEMIFSLPGLGSLLLTATERFDYPVITGVSLCVVLFFSLMNIFSGSVRISQGFKCLF
jgi:peptide/nickel transport system permease protein